MAVPFEKSLEFLFPDLAKEWDFTLNGSLRPNECTPGMHKMVWWKCPICGQSYPAKICNRTAPSKQKKNKECPVCLGYRIVPGFNSLKAKFPHIVEQEWAYDLNNYDPDMIAPHSNHKYYWRCSKGHVYEASANNKTSGNGGNCPYCSHQRLLPEYSLAALNPTLAQEWDYERNGFLTPTNVAASSNKIVFWICSKCGYSWKARICNRHQLKRGCPNCRKGRQTSFPEQALFYHIHKIFPDAINRHKLFGFEVDVFIPQLNVALEYDGARYHNSNESLLRDRKKDRGLKEKGIKLIRIREEGCAELKNGLSQIYKFDYSSDYVELGKIIHNIIIRLSEEFNLHIENSFIVDMKEHRNEILAEIDVLRYEDSFAYYIKCKQDSHEPIVALWDNEKNYPLTPEMVSPMSEIEVFWLCPNIPKHKGWKNTVKSVSLGYGCKICSGRQRRSNEEWITEARRIHKDRYDYSKTVYKSSSEPVTIICPIHGEFIQMPSEHLVGKGCRFCAHQDFHPSESLASLYPKIASEWDYEKNKNSGFSPETIGIDSTRIFYWKCDKGKSHSYQATISYRVHRNSGCAICHGKQIDETTSLKFLRPDLCLEWDESNTKSPSEYTVGSESKVYWKCKNPNHEPYLASIYNRAHLGSGCPYCSGNKKHPKDFADELKVKHPHILLIEEFTKSKTRLKCKCELCGHVWTPYPFNLLKVGCPKCKNKNGN